MTENRIKELVNKGFITKVSDIDDLMKMSELDLVKAGYITQVGIFDGEDDTEEEVPAVAPVAAPVVVEEDKPVAPVEDEPTTPVEDEDVPVEDESDAPVVDEGEE